MASQNTQNTAAPKNTLQHIGLNGSLTHRLLAAALAFGFVACDAEPDAAPMSPEVAEPEAAEPESPEPESPEPEAAEPEMAEPEMTEPEPTRPAPEDWVDPSEALPAEAGVYAHEGRDCLTTGAGGVVFCGAWARNAEMDRWEVTGDVDILLSGGAVHTIFNAELVSNADGTAVNGTGETAFPTGQYWDDEDTEDDEIVDVTISSPPEFEDAESEVSGVEFQGGMGFENDALGFFSDAGAVLDPALGVVKTVGDFGMGILDDTVMEGAEVTFALFDPKPFQTRGPFYDGEGWVDYDLRSAAGIKGRVHMLPFPVIVDGEVNLDLDSNGDGDLFWTDGAIALSADGALSLGYDRFGFDIDMEIADAAVVLDCARGTLDRGAPCGLDLRSHAGVESIFDGTPLELLPLGAEAGLYAHYEGVDDFVIRAEVSGDLLWMSVDEGHVELGDDGVTAALTVNNLPLPGQAMSVRGGINADGDFALTGTHDVTIAGFTLTAATISVTNDGATATGQVDLPGFGSATVTGELNTDDPRFEGTGDITVAGFRIANAAVTLDSAGLEVRGMIDLPGVARVEVDGRIDDNPVFRGRSEMRPAGFRIADGAVELSLNGARIHGRVNLPNVAEVDISGMVSTAGDFELTGRANISPVGVNIADADIHVSPQGARVTGRMAFAGIHVEVSGDVQRNGAFRFEGNAGVDFDQDIIGHRVQLSGGVDFAVGHDILRAGFHAEATITPPNLPVGPDSVTARVAGSLNSDGEITLDLPLIGSRTLDIF